jgi:hypothetical protein
MAGAGDSACGRYAGEAAGKGRKGRRRGEDVLCSALEFSHLAGLTKCGEEQGGGAPQERWRKRWCDSVNSLARKETSGTARECSGKAEYRRRRSWIGENWGETRERSGDQSRERRSGKCKG